MARVPAQERRADLVQAAIQVATREGLAATTTRRIAQELGISVGIVHYCFRSKEELLHEVIRVIAEAQVVAARSAITPGGDLPTSVRNAFLGFWQLVEATPQAQLLTYELTSWALRNAETEPLAREQRASQLAGIEAILAEISKATEVEWTVPAEQLARMTLAVTDGVTLGWLVDRDTASAVQTMEIFAEQLLAWAG
ncbi:TetR/AcrR family transcriptional regulator [Kribbella sp. CA-293567]|uniref:TetR/AcrR family transcriptional regulator n=1 Tax=Kribbella sp. CA-293567 TaxID=3002436 RepID=UPI0022DD4131|nr:TetR/AcrR family transcriptional regulator [Kribbella sp. CA-293567]WBQ04508.1 TetR family transcriptional regulator [Kribbella sp. CA-293567]